MGERGGAGDARTSRSVRTRRRSIGVLAEPPVAWVDANTAKHGTHVAKAYQACINTDEGQRLACKWGYRPRNTALIGKCGTSLARTDLTTIADFGGWKTAQARYFDEGGMFDQIYASK